MSKSYDTPITFLFVSDIHLGSPLLNLAGMDYTRFQSKLDTIRAKNNCAHTFYLGDTFDRSISIDEPIYNAVKTVFSSLVKPYLEPLTFLKGTTSHDGIYQIPNLLEEVENVRALSDLDADYLDTWDYSVKGLGYINEIRVETLHFKYEQRGITFGFIPDNMPGTKEEIVEELKSQMKKNGLETIDYLLTHVLWDYHVDPKRIRPDIPVFSQSDFPFVNKHIVSGHIHQHKEMGKLIVCGSATRTRYEETDTKGVTVIRDYGDRTEVEFIPLYEKEELHVFYPTEPYSKLTKEIETTIYRDDDCLHDCVVFPVYAELDTYLQTLLSEGKINEKEMEDLKSYFNVDQAIERLKKRDPNRMVVKVDIPHYLLNTEHPLPSIPASASQKKRKQVWVNHILSIMGQSHAK